MFPWCKKPTSKTEDLITAQGCPLPPKSAAKLNTAAVVRHTVSLDAAEEATKEAPSVRSETTTRKSTDVKSAPAAAPATRQQLVMVMGDKGVGKSTLVTALNNRLAATGGVSREREAATTPNSSSPSAPSAAASAHRQPPPLKLVEWNSSVAASLQRLKKTESDQGKKGSLTQKEVQPLLVPRIKSTTAPLKITHTAEVPHTHHRETCVVEISRGGRRSEEGEGEVEEGEEMQTIAAAGSPKTSAVAYFSFAQQQLTHGALTTQQEQLPRKHRGIRALRPEPLKRDYLCSHVPTLRGGSGGAVNTAAVSPIRHAMNHHHDKGRGLLVQCFLLCYDIGDSASFFYLAAECLIHVRELSGPGAKVLVVGTKADTAHTRREVMDTQGSTLATSLGGSFLEVDSCHGGGIGIDQLLSALSKQ